MDGVAPEIAEEILMLLEHGHPDSGAREQQARDHPGRPAADDAKLGRDPLRHG